MKASARLRQGRRVFSGRSLAEAPDNLQNSFKNLSMKIQARLKISIAFRGYLPRAIAARAMGGKRLRRRLKTEKAPFTGQYDLADRPLRLDGQGLVRSLAFKCWRQGACFRAAGNRAEERKRGFINSLRRSIARG